MKSAVPLCLALLLSLTACGQGAAAPVPEAAVANASSPAAAVTPAPLPELLPLTWQVTEPESWALDPSQFPDQPVDGQAQLSYAIDAPSGVVLLTQLPEADAKLYGVWNYGEDYEGLVLQIGDRWEPYALLWYTPRCCLPQLHSGDFDGDGAEELAILTCTGSGTGVDAWTLSLVETGQEPWQVRTIPDSAYDDLFSPYFDCAYDAADRQIVLGLGDDRVLADVSYMELPSNVKLEAYTGPIVTYKVEGDALTANLAVGIWGSGAIPYTVFYPADIQAQLMCQEDGFSLSRAVMADEL